MGTMDSHADGSSPEIGQNNPGQNPVAHYTKCTHCQTEWTGNITKCPECGHSVESLPAGHGKLVSVAEPKINIHCDIFQALVSLVSINEKGIDPFAVLHEAQFVIQEVMAGRMDFDTVTPGDDLRIPASSDEQ